MNGSPQRAQIYRPLVPVVVAVFLPVLLSPGVHQEALGDLASHQPTSETIAVVTRNGIWLLEADGSGQRRLTTRLMDRSPVWSPDGEVVAFIQASSKGLRQLRIIAADGSDGQVLIERWQGDEPTWSPDGNRFAYYCSCDGSIHVMDLDGSDDLPITRSHATRSPAWSPDGSKVAYSAPIDRRFRIFIVDPGGTVRTRITQGGGSDHWPAWSADSTRLVFSRWHRGDGWDLFVVDVETSAVVRLNRTPNLNEIKASWSPDGSRLVFVGFRRGARRSFLYIAASDGSGRIRLVDRPVTDVAWRPV